MSKTEKFIGLTGYREHIQIRKNIKNIFVYTAVVMRNGVFTSTKTPFLIQS